MTGPLTGSAGLIVLPAYFLATILIGFLARRESNNSGTFLNATRSLPLWIVVAAYLAANCGALEIVGLSAMAAQYGAQAFHFYWLGAIPAMIFLALWMMPVYRASGVRSVPEYLELRYGAPMRLVNACLLAIIMLLLAGISLYAMGQVLDVVIGLNFSTSILLSAGVVLFYVLLGGVRATIYNEVFQLLVMLAGLVPLAVRIVRLHLLRSPGSDSPLLHIWKGLPAASQSAPLDGVGIVFGLGFILSFGYWCTDFVLMQRAFTARTELEARQVPLWAGFGKLLFSFIVVLPGLAAHRLLPQLGAHQRFDQALPALMKLFYGPAMLGLGLTALSASLMSGLASNVSAFAALWTEDIYRSHLRPGLTDAHYLRMGKIATLAAVAASLSATYLNFYFADLMEHVQLIFSVFNAPFWAIFLLGMATPSTNSRGALAGFLSGTGLALLHFVAVTQSWIHYGSAMSANFHIAIYAFLTTLLVSLVISALSRQTEASSSTGLIFNWRPASRIQNNKLLWILSALLISTCILLNILWR